MDPNKVLTPQYQISGLNINLPNVTPTMVDQVDNLSDLSGETVSRPNEVVIPKKSVKPRGTATTNSNVITPVENTLDLSGETQARVPYETAPYIFSTSSTSTPATSNPTVTSTPSNDWGSGIVNLFTDIAALAPTISNMYAKPESFNAVYNPYEAQIN
jgi:hypothetical protein